MGIGQTGEMKNKELSDHSSDRRCGHNRMTTGLFYVLSETKFERTKCVHVKQMRWFLLKCQPMPSCELDENRSFPPFHKPGTPRCRANGTYFCREYRGK